MTGVAGRIQSRILKLKQPRTLHNQPDLGPDPRGRKRAILRSETAAIGHYVDDIKVSQEDKGNPWLDITEDAGVSLPKTTHFKPPGLRAVEPQTVQRAYKVDEDIINVVCEEEKELTRAQADSRND